MAGLAPATPTGFAPRFNNRWSQSGSPGQARPRRPRV